MLHARILPQSGGEWKVNFPSLFARMIEEHWEGIAAYCQPENKVSLGFVEGLNNKTRVIQRRAYGLRDEEFMQSMSSNTPKTTHSNSRRSRNKDLMMVLNSPIG